jgi:hypothetical protein
VTVLAGEGDRSRERLSLFDGYAKVAAANRSRFPSTRRFLADDRIDPIDASTPDGKLLRLRVMRKQGSNTRLPELLQPTSASHSHPHLPIGRPGRTTRDG